MIGWLLVAGTLSLVPLHRTDGHVVFIAPAQVTSIAEPRQTGDPGKLSVPGANCVVFLSDHRFFSVTETCPEVRMMLQGKP